MKPSECLGIGFFVHPFPLLSVGLLALNDHYLKYAYPGSLTGKLSDFCGLFFFPLFLCALFVVLRRQKAVFSFTMLVMAVVLTDVVFIAIKLWPEASVLYLRVLSALGFPSRNVRDPSDLIALAANLFTFLHARRFY